MDPGEFANLMTVLTTTALTLGTLLAIITAGLMFTQGKFSELISELNNKSSDYLASRFSMGTFQAIGAHLSTLREEFQSLKAAVTIDEEKNLYAKIVEKVSSMIADCAVLLNLGTKQKGLPPTDLFVSGMDPSLYAMYQKRRQGIRKDWQLLILLKRMTDVLKGPRTGFMDELDGWTPLDDDIRRSLAILKFKESVEKSQTNSGDKIRTALDDLSRDVEPVDERLHEERIPQLLSQMKQLNAVRGKYFHLAVVFIAVPLLIDLLVLPQLSPDTAAVFKPIIFAASLLSVLGVAFLLLYVYKILNV